jgi:hypothetical protein
MFKFKAAFLLAMSTLLFSFAAVAQTRFYNSVVRDWTVRGHHQHGELHPTCIAEKNFQDGSFISMVKDLADGELYVLYQNTAWNIADNPGNYQMRINFYASRSAPVVSHLAQYELLNKNTIRIRNIDSKKFLPTFVEYLKMSFIMPGSIPNVEFTLAGSREMISVMSDCMGQFKESLNVPTKPGMNL